MRRNWALKISPLVAGGVLGVLVACLAAYLLLGNHATANVIAMLAIAALAAGAVYSGGAVRFLWEDVVVWVGAISLILIGLRAYHQGVLSLAILGVDLEPTTILGVITCALALWAGRVYGGRGYADALLFGALCFTTLLSVGSLFDWVFEWSALHTDVSWWVDVGWFAGVASLISATGLLTIFVRTREGKDGERGRLVLYCTTLILAGCVWALWFFSPSLAPLIGAPQPPSEVVPSVQLTYHLATAVAGSSMSAALFGLGPGSFVQAWNGFRPLGVNRTPLWNVEPEVGHDLLQTGAIEYGLFWPVLLLTGLVLLGAHAWRHRYRKAGIRVMACVCCTLFASVTVLPSTSIFALLVLLLGVTWGEIDSEQEQVRRASSLTLTLIALAVGVLVLFSALLIIMWYREARVHQTVATAGWSTIEIADYLAREPMTQTALIQPLLLRSQLITTVRDTAIANGQLAPESVDALVDMARQGAEYTAQAYALDQRVSTALLGVEHHLFRAYGGEARDANAVINVARTELFRARFDPRPPYVLATAYYSQEEYDLANQYIELSLRLKPDFVEALQLREVLTAAMHDTPSLASPAPSEKPVAHSQAVEW